MATETGEIVKSVIRSSHSDMTVHFQSDHIGTRKGFNIKVQFVLSGKCMKFEIYEHVQRKIHSFVPT